MSLPADLSEPENYVAKLIAALNHEEPMTRVRAAWIPGQRHETQCLPLSGLPNGAGIPTCWRPLRKRSARFPMRRLPQRSFVWPATHTSKPGWRRFRPSAISTRQRSGRRSRARLKTRMSWSGARPSAHSSASSTGQDEPHNRSRDRDSETEPHLCRGRERDQ